MVKEFVVRLLYSIDGSSVETLQNYFGFTNVEIQAVLDDLLAESLIEWDDDKIKLTHYASGKFIELDGRMIPRFFEVADKVDTVHFELHGFKMLPNSIKKSRANSLSISLSLSNECYKKLNEKAQSAFDSNFHHFREIVKGDDIFADRQELYKINHVADKYDNVIPIEVEYFIESSTPTELKTGYESLSVDEWDDDKKLFTTMDDSIPRNHKKDESKELLNYLEATKDPFLVKYWDETRKSLNHEVLVNHFESGIVHQTKDTQLILGNFYSDINSSEIIKKLKLSFESKPDSSGLIWFTNSDSSTWGRTNSLSYLISSIYSFFDKRKKTSNVVLVMGCNSKEEAFELHKIYGMLEAHLLDCSNRFGGDLCEILLIPNVMVACLYHASIDEHRDISMPVGYISFDKELIKIVMEKALVWTDSGTKFNHYFEKKFMDEKETVLNKAFKPILAQQFSH